MPTPTRKGIFLVLLAMCLVVAVAVIPDIISEEMRAWCLSTFGEGYQGYLLGFFVVGSVVLLFLTTDIGLHLRPGAGNKSADLPPGTPDPDLVAKVRKYLTERYDHRLSQKMAGRQPVNLRILPSITGTSKEGAENYITLQEEEVRAAIGDIFTRANGRLLLVGLPGSGKTTLVLQLAMHLLERPGSSMPVVLNLATWRTEFKTFEEWLTKILPTELGASTGLAEQIRKHTPLILLLDGLDEVPEADRDSLLAGIGEYGADANRQFLISSRIAEYAATKDAPVNAQVEVAPLTVEQVEIGLAATAGLQPESKRLLNALKSDPLLREAVENPFYLNTAQLLFSTGKNWSEFGFAAKDVTGRQRELVERFVEGALGRKVSHEYPPDKAGHWLSFLASRMTERNMVVFELRDLQYDWWKWTNEQLRMARFVAGLAFGIKSGIILFLVLGGTIGLVYTIVFGIISGLKWGLLFGLAGLFGSILGVLPAWKSVEITTRDNVDSTWHNFFKHFEKSLVNGLLGGLVIGLCLGLILGIAKGFEDGNEFNYLGIGAVAFSTGIIGTCFGALGLALWSLITENTYILQINTPFQRFNSSSQVLHFAILQFWLLCYQLKDQGLLPKDFVEFLNKMSSHHILETDGATWRFRHRILQEWFAEKWVEEEENKSKTK